MTQAHWFASRWRYRTADAIGWTYAELRADVPADATTVQRRVGTRRSGYTYETVAR